MRGRRSFDNYSKCKRTRSLSRECINFITERKCGAQESAHAEKFSLNQFVTRRSREVCAIEIVSGKLNNCQSNWWTRRRKIYFYLLLPDSPDDVGM